MVTGIEAAGLVLGAFPLLLQGLNYYISSAGKVKELWNHRDTLKQFTRDIRTEMTIFKNSWSRLQQMVGGDPDADIGDMLCWSDKLKSHLDRESITSIGDTCEGLNEILDALVQKFEKYERTKVRIYNSSSVQAALDLKFCGEGWILEDVIRYLQPDR